jgi:hypothetical protein
MQGKKIITPQLFYHQSLDEMVPEDNFYRKINENLSLDFLYKITAPYYGKCRKESIDPVVFFKPRLRIRDLEGIIHSIIP